MEAVQQLDHCDTNPCAINQHRHGAAAIVPAPGRPLRHPPHPRPAEATRASAELEAGNTKLGLQHTPAILADPIACRVARQYQELRELAALELCQPESWAVLVAPVWDLAIEAERAAVLALKCQPSAA